MAEKVLTPKTVYRTLGGFCLLAGASTLILYSLGIQYESIVSLSVSVIFAITTFGFWTYQKGKLNLAIGIGAILLSSLYAFPIIQILSTQSQVLQYPEFMVGLWGIVFFVAALFVIGLLHLRRRKEREPLKQVWRSAQWFYIASFGTSIVLLSSLKSPASYAGMVLGSYVALSGILKGVWATRSGIAHSISQADFKKANLKEFFLFILDFREAEVELIKRINLFGVVAFGTLAFGIYGFGDAGMTQQLAYSGLVICFHAVFVLSRFHAKGRELLVEENARVSQELRTAHDMQMGLMPTEDPVVKGYEVSGVCLPANEVGGDFYDYVWLDKKKTMLGIALADVSGKAMKAAMPAVMTSGMLYSEAQKSQRPREILARINKPLYLRSDKRVFTAMSFGTLDTRRKRLVYSSAGQTVPVLVRNGKTSYLKTKGVRLPLGVKENLQYAEVQIKLKRDDVVVFYTDGISEARNTNDEQYGSERLEQLLKYVNSSSAKDIRERIFEDVRNFAGTTQQHDDMTVVVVKVN